jgi:hypothetical protein
MPFFSIRGSSHASSLWSRTYEVLNLVQFLLLVLLGLAVVPVGIGAVPPPVDRQREGEDEDRDGGRVAG